MPVALQVLLVAGLLLYTNSRFPGFVNATNIPQILILALPLIVAAMAQTHALLVGYLDLSVGGMIGLGVVIASFLIGAEASAPQILIGIGVILLCGVALGLVNAGLIRGLKIPSIIATLATLSILDGISLTMRPTAQGVINPGLVSALTTTIGPIPVAFIVIVVGAALADVWLHASGSGLGLRAAGFDERSAKRGGVRTNWLRVRALVLSAVLAAVAAFFVMARSPIGNATIGSTFALNSITAAVLGGASLAGGRATFIGSTVAALLLALIITVLPYLGLSPDDGPMIIGVLVLLGIVLFQLGDIKELVKSNYKRARRLVVGSRPPKAAAAPGLLPERPGLPRGAVGQDADPRRDGAQHGPRARGPPIGRRADRGGEDPRGRAGPVERRGRGDRRGGHDRHARVRRLPPAHLGGPAPQHRDRRPAGGQDELHLVRPAQAGAGVPTGRRVRRQPGLGARSDRRGDHHPSRLVAHPGLARPHRRGDPGAGRLRTPGGVRVRVPMVGEVGGAAPSWFVRAATEHFSSKDQKLTLALAAPGPEFTDFEITRDHWKLARETDARITTHVGVGSYGQDGKLQEFGEAGLLGADTTYIHCTTLNDTEIQMIVDTGGTVSLASPVEMMMGHGMPPIQKFLDRGLRPSLSVDVETNVPADLFNQMRSVLGLQRAIATAEGKAPVSTREVLGYATVEGAKANGLETKVGTLTPGKQADVILLRTDRMNVTPLDDPATAVVAGMDTGNVDTVLIGGRVMKRHGQLLHVDWPALRDKAAESRDFVIDKSGFKLPGI